MEYKFTRSVVVMGQLAKESSRTPPSEGDSPFEYVDRSLMILGRTFDMHGERMRQEFLGQRDFIASQFREVEKKMDGRFEEVEKKMDGRFEEVEKKMDGRFEEVDRRFQNVDRRFDKQESEIRDIKAQLENTAAVTRNGHLRRMHQPINLIKVLKLAGDPNRFVWASHPQVPKHMKDTYILGQRAKGIFEPSWEEKSTKQSTYLMARCFVLSLYLFIYKGSTFLTNVHVIVVINLANIVFIEAHAKQKATHTINELAKFYNTVIWSDEESESDATGVMLQEFTVDEYMEALLVEWGMDWQKVLKLGMQHMQAQPQQAGAKRAGDTSSKEEKKKARGSREAEVD
jgi:hypothetical protein